MHVSRQFQGSVAVLTIRDSMVEGELDILDRNVRECVEAGAYRLVLDMKAVPAIDSAALERLQDLASDLGKRGGDLRLAALTETCQDIFLATRMDNFLHVSRDRDSAVRSLL